MTCPRWTASTSCRRVGETRQADRETDRRAEIELSFGVSPGSGCSPGPLQLNAGPPYRSRLYLCLYQLPRRLSVDGSAHWLYSARSRSIASTGILPHRSGWSALALAMDAMDVLGTWIAVPCCEAGMQFAPGPIYAARSMALCTGPWRFPLLYILFLSLALVPSSPGTCSLPLPPTSLKTNSTKSFTRSSDSSADPNTNNSSVSSPRLHPARNRTCLASGVDRVHSSIVPSLALATYTPFHFVDPRAGRQPLLKHACSHRGRPLSLRPSSCLSDPTTARRQPPCPPVAGPRLSRR